MTPAFKVEANGTDVTKTLQADMVSIAFSDEDGNQSDEITIVVAGDFKRPKYEDELKLWLGYEEMPLFYCGLFRVQTTEKNNSGMTITATGADFTSELKKKRDKTYEQVSIAKVAGIIADRHTLKLKSNCDDLMLTHLSQTNESDMALLKRLAGEYDLLFSVKNGTLVMLHKTNGMKRSEDLPTFTIDVAECSEWSVKNSNKTLYGSCRASWHDTAENNVQSVAVGYGDPVLEIGGQFKTAAEAKEKAEARLSTANRGTKSGSLSMYGAPIYAGGTLTLTGAGDDDGDYTITGVDHSFAGGWTMTVKFEN